MSLRNSRTSKPVGRPRKHKNDAERQRAYRQRLKRSVHFRSDSHLWSTPQALFDELNAEFHFTADVCALPDNAKCAVFYTPEQDGLQQAWAGVCWCNPPYGREIAKWVQKAYESVQSGAMVVCLLPARVDTRWWHDYVVPSAEVRYLKGRLKFGGGENSAPFPSAVVIFRPIASAIEADQRLLGRRQGFESKTHGSLHARTIEPFTRRPFTKLEVSKRLKRTDLSLDLQGVTPGRERGV